MKKFRNLAIILGILLTAALAGAGVAWAQFFTDAELADPGELLARVFVFGIGLAALSAFLVFTFGGLMYLTAGDNESRVTQAKTYMGNAVLGLVIALTSWLILYTINPDLVLKLNINALLEQFRVTSVPESKNRLCGKGVCPIGYGCISTSAGPACKDPNNSRPCKFTQCPPNYSCVDTASGAACIPPKQETGGQCGPSGTCDKNSICVDPVKGACQPLCNLLTGAQGQCKFGDPGSLAGCTCPGAKPPKDCGLERIWICTN